MSSYEMAEQAIIWVGTPLVDQVLEEGKSLASNLFGFDEDFQRWGQIKCTYQHTRPAPEYITVLVGHTDHGRDYPQCQRKRIVADEI